MTQSMNLMQTGHQSQVLAPQMRQSLNMLLMNHLELKAELQQQMATNPVIEDVTSPMERPLSTQLPEEHMSGEISEHELDFRPDGDAAQKTLAADDGDRDYYLQNLENYTPTQDNGLPDPDAQSRRQVMFDRQVHNETLHEHLLKQIPLSNIPESDYSLAELLIEQINNEGYFKGSMADVQMISNATEERIRDTLAQIAMFDPMGCGGCSLRECLLFQMEKLDDSPWENEVRQVIDKHLEDLASHRENEVCSALGITRDDFQKVLMELRTLDPAPGRSFASQSDALIYVRPEIFLRSCKDGTWLAQVEDRDLPKIHISTRYLHMLEDPKCTAEAKSYIRERVRAAELLIQSLAERQNTIRNIAQAIVDAQTRVFETKSMANLKPLTMEQVAKKTGVHTATVSRTVRNKYMATPLGLIELRKFFTSGIQTAGGGEVSNVAVKEEIRKLIQDEDKTAPLSDEAISKKLAACGIKCARRTVAKYRESLGIPGTGQRVAGRA